jgi:ABC-type antimicrobial peptide transport system permease subunit
VDPEIGIARVATLDALVARQLRERRFLMTLIGAFATAAIVIATVGVFGVMNQAAAERTREIAVRMAVGASPRTILSEFLGEAGIMTAAGVALGVGLAAIATRAIARFLYGVAPMDVYSLSLATGFVVLLAMTAAALPSWRAARTNPASVLNQG